MTIHDEVGRRVDRTDSAAATSAAVTGLAPSGDHQATGAGFTPGKSTRGADRAFRLLTVGAGALIVAFVAFIFVELVIQAVPSIQADKVNFVSSDVWKTTNATNLQFGIWGLLKTTVLSSVFALLLAVPVAIGIATFLVQYAPARLSRVLSAVIDLLAAVPSIVFGLWGLIVLGPFLVPVAKWLNENLSWIPLFDKGNVSISGGGTVFTAGIVLAIMILPIITSIARETIRQTPALHQEAALALGATKWEKIRMTCFPYARSGMMAGAMLALGRALGETVAVLIILRTATKSGGFSLFDGGSTFASKIASGAAEFSEPLPTGAYIAAGLVLFVLTFLVNAIARSVAGGKVNS